MRNRLAGVLITGILVGVSLNTTGLAQTETPLPATEAQLQQQRDQQVAKPTGTVEDAIAKVQAAGLMNGYPDGQFHAERPITRAELASILAKTFKLKERKLTQPVSVQLQDIPAGYWAAGDIRTVVRHGVMEGYRDGYFYPNQKINRAEALAIFAQAYGVQQANDKTVQSVLSQYQDASEIPDWARKAMVTSLKNGFVDAGPTQQIRPRQPMTRGDMAFALNQYLNRLHGSEQETLH